MRDQAQLPRYALYFAPAAGSAWDRFGASWLGRSAHTGVSLAQPEIRGLDAARFRALTGAPRRYGFHATLKPPFRLAAGCTPDDLLLELTQVFGQIPSFAMAPRWASSSATWSTPGWRSGWRGAPTATA